VHAKREVSIGEIGARARILANIRILFYGMKQTKKKVSHSFRCVNRGFGNSKRKNILIRTRGLLTTKRKSEMRRENAHRNALSFLARTCNALLGANQLLLIPPTSASGTSFALTSPNGASKPFTSPSFSSPLRYKNFFVSSSSSSSFPKRSSTRTRPPVAPETTRDANKTIAIAQTIANRDGFAPTAFLRPRENDDIFLPSSFRVFKKIHFSKEEEEETAKEKKFQQQRENENNSNNNSRTPTRESNASISARISRGGLFGI
jgi:hypothetical protein